MAADAGERLLSLLPVTEENARRIYSTYWRLSRILKGEKEKRIALLTRAVASGLPEKYARELRRSLVWALWQSARKREAFELWGQWHAPHPPGSPAAFIAAVQEARC